MDISFNCIKNITVVRLNLKNRLRFFASLHFAMNLEKFYRTTVKKYIIIISLLIGI
jgi:hypothetical protein